MSLRVLAFAVLSLGLGAASARAQTSEPSSSDDAASWRAALRWSEPVEVDGADHSYGDWSAGVKAVVTTTFSASGSPTSIQIQTGDRSISFNPGLGDTLSPLQAVPALLHGRAADGARQAVVPDVKALGWDYQSFGVWQTGQGLGGVGAVSVGAATAPSALPQTGAARFSGYAAGIWGQADGTSTVVAGSATAMVDFGQRTARLTTGGTFGADGRGYPLALSGDLAWAAGTNRLTGAITTIDGRLTGAGVARFFGPAAEELGGTFAVKNGAGSETFIGGFGLKR